MVERLLNYWGGKGKMAKHIIPLILYENNTVYIEPYGGSLAVFFIKPPHKHEIINDLRSDLINFYKFVKTNLYELEELINMTLYARQEFDLAKTVAKNPYVFTLLYQAWAVFVVQNFSHMATGRSFLCGKTPNGSKASFVHRKKSVFNHELEDRFKNVSIECMDAVKIIQTYDSPDAFFYLDPPYIGCNNDSYEDFSVEDYIKLLEALAVISGRFILSGYNNQYLDGFVAKNGWIKKEVSIYKNSVNSRGSDNTVAVEVLVMNYNPASNDMFL